MDDDVFRAKKDHKDYSEKVKLMRIRIVAL